MIYNAFYSILLGMINKKQKTLNQRGVVDKKLMKWLGLRTEPAPRSGWLKAIRGSLGISSSQLAKLMGINQANVTRLEKREAKGTASFESVNQAARAMNCKVIYAIVPDDNYQSLEEVITEKSNNLAQTTLKKLEHSMELEKQSSGVSLSDVEKLSNELKVNLDPRLWKKK